MLSDSDLRVIVLARSDPGVFNIRYDNMIAMAGMARELLRYREAAKHRAGAVDDRLEQALNDGVDLNPTQVRQVIREVLAYRKATQ